jgi:hypothetical protein
MKTLLKLVMGMEKPLPRTVPRVVKEQCRSKTQKCTNQESRQQKCIFIIARKFPLHRQFLKLTFYFLG